MARFYVALQTDPRHCQRCGRPAKLFGLRDVETGWMGYCMVCNADWKIQLQDHRFRCCNCNCNVTSPPLCGLRCGIPLIVALNINSYLVVEGSILHRMVMRRHKRKLQLLEWTCSRLDWFLADDSSDEFNDDDDPPTLSSLRHVHLSARTLLSLRYEDLSNTLLDAIYMYVKGAPHLEDHTTMYYVHKKENTWQLFEFQGSYWLWNNCTDEWFFVNAPPQHWQRYYYFASFPRTAATIFWWWHNASRGVWFVEPSNPMAQLAAYVTFLRKYRWYTVTEHALRKHRDSDSCSPSSLPSGAGCVTLGFARQSGCLAGASKMNHRIHARPSVGEGKE